MELTHLLFCSKRKQNCISMLECSLMSLLQWKTRFFLRISISGLGKGICVDSLACSRAFRKSLKSSSRKTISFLDMDISSLRIYRCWVFISQNPNNLMAKFFFCWNLYRLEVYGDEVEKCYKDCDKNTYIRLFRPKNFPEPLRILIIVCSNCEIAF